MENIKKIPVVYRNNYVPDTGLERFQKVIERKYKLKFDSYKELHKWTVENYTKFWGELWNFLEVISSVPYNEVFVKTGPGFLDNEWFSGARLNYAENILRIRDDRIALLYLDELGNEETVTFAEMFEEVKLYAAAFRKNGLKIGDRVACFMSNRKEAIFAMLAVASIGGMWGGPVPFYGARAASNVVKMMEPKFLIAIDEHQNNGIIFPTLDYLPEIVNNSGIIEKVILIITKKETRKKDLSNIRNCVFLEDFLDEGRTADGKVPDIVFEQLSFNQPLNINFTSGTSGLPKDPVHSAGTFLSLMRDYVLSYNLKPGDVLCLNIPVGWCIWQFCVPSLALGVTILLHCCSMYYSHSGKNYWDIMSRYNVNLTILITSMIDKMEKMRIQPSPGTNMDSLKMVGIIGLPVKVENFEYIRNKVKTDVHVVNLYGATEGFGLFSGFNMNMPVYAGEVQVPGLGIDLKCFDSEGNSVVGKRGELVVCTPAPIFPISFWKDENNRRITEIYLSSYPGVWSQHDIGWINPKRDGFIVIGRSDDTLKQKGERFGSQDIYFAIHDLEELEDYICVGQMKDADNRAILFVKLQKGYKMIPELRTKIAKKIDEVFWKSFVPEVILEVPDIPYNMNNKRLESVVRKIVATNTIPAVTNIKNPDCLKHFLNIPEIVNYNHQ